MVGINSISHKRRLKFAPVIFFSGDVFVTAGELEAHNNAESASAASANVGVVDDGERPLQKSTLYYNVLQAYYYTSMDVC